MNMMIRHTPTGASSDRDEIWAKSVADLVVGPAAGGKVHPYRHGSHPVVDGGPIITKADEEKDDGQKEAMKGVTEVNESVNGYGDGAGGERR